MLQQWSAMQQQRYRLRESDTELLRLGNVCLLLQPYKCRKAASCKCVTGPAVLGFANNVDGGRLGRVVNLARDF
jgi:hypothetical protein